MSVAATVAIDEDFDYLLSFLPPEWQDKARELGALRRCRKIPGARVLLRLLLIHLAEGCSLRETAVRARQGGLIEVSDVAIMDRLRSSGEWLRWMSTELMARWVASAPAAVFGSRFSVRLVDATHVKEPGPTGSCWRLHYAVELPSLRCTQLEVTSGGGTECGESLCRFAVRPGELFIADRGYGAPRGIAHVVDGGGQVLVRFGWRNLPLENKRGGRFDLLARLRRLEGAAVGDWPVWIKHGARRIAGRVCAVKKSRQAAERARRQARLRAQKHGETIRAQTLEAAGYVFVFTTVAADQLGAADVLEFYRGRWQIELVFKRLKSLVGLGHLRKSDPKAACAWLHGKLLVAFLVEALRAGGESFSPWGYPLQPLPRS
jgi:hypothetical protein